MTTPAPAAPAAHSVAGAAPSDLIEVVDDLLESLSSRFAAVSNDIYEKIDAMSKRLDAMEASFLQAQQQQQGGGGDGGK